jgi:nitroimidazol reductase NimA-like FMN-containing flavoprotein (pyridoxamine 5'-phosphate oxidase superfamily)
MDRSSDPVLEELSYEQCLEHLASETVGRLAVVIRHYPQVFVVNYRLDDFVVVFRTGDGPLLDAVNHANVGFQVDHIDPASHAGWSVLVQGMAEDVTRRRDFGAQRARTLGVDPWVGERADHLVRVIPARITGRELLPARSVR